MPLTPERLEERRLLSVFTGFSQVRNIATPAGIFTLQVSGSGILKAAPAGHGAIDLKVLGTNSSSSLSITQVRPRYHLAGQLLPIRDLTIRSGQIGNILAAPVELDGTMTPLTTSVSTLEFGALGAGAQIDVAGSVGSMTVGEVDLGPGGHVVIAGDLNGSGQGSAMSIDNMSINGGHFVIGRDSLAPISIAGDLRLDHDGLFSIGRDQVGTLTIGGSIIMGAGGELMVGRNLTSLTVTGDVLLSPGASGIVVGGDLNGLSVNGIFLGQGSPTSVDLGVGLNLNGFSVLGGTANAGGVQSANINVGKNINLLNVPHGIFRSLITAGVSITGVTVGADGVTAIYNSELDAGTSITNVTANGDVKSGFPTGDPTGFPTRIIAGKIRSANPADGPNKGIYLPNGLINNLTINGNLVDAVVAASVVPFGGDGSLPPPPSYMTPTVTYDHGATPSNYQAPGGITDLDNGASFPNYSIRNVVGGVPTGEAAWIAPVGQRHDAVLPNGTVNLTLDGIVISTPHDDSFDFAGVFAVNTVGVKSGPAPAP
jgi:hypothetical protein